MQLTCLTKADAIKHILSVVDKENPSYFANILKMDFIKSHYVNKDDRELIDNIIKEIRQEIHK
jgi:hypothetical protein